MLHTSAAGEQCAKFPVFRGIGHVLRQRTLNRQETVSDAHRYGVFALAEPVSSCSEFVSRTFTHPTFAPLFMRQ